MDKDGVSALIENMTSKYGDMKPVTEHRLHEHKEHKEQVEARAGARDGDCADKT